MSMLDDVRFWAQVIRDSRRVVVCSPELESRVKTAVAAHGLTGMVEVRVNRWMPDDTLMVVDEQGMAAEQAKPIRWDDWRP